MREAPDPTKLEDSDQDELVSFFDATDAGAQPWEDASEVAIERPELEQISLRLPKDDLAALKRRASATGVGYTTLIRMILRRYLRDALAR